MIRRGRPHCRFVGKRKKGGCGGGGLCRTTRRDTGGKKHFWGKKKVTQTLSLCLQRYWPRFCWSPGLWQHSGRCGGSRPPSSSFSAHRGEAWPVGVVFPVGGGKVQFVLTAAQRATVYIWKIKESTDFSFVLAANEPCYSQLSTVREYGRLLDAAVWCYVSTANWKWLFIRWTNAINKHLKQKNSSAPAAETTRQTLFVPTQAAINKT